MNRNIIAPKININGTSVETLIVECRKAHAAVSKAREMVAGMTVHGRDYQTFPPEEARERLRLAVVQQDRWIRAIEDVQKDIAALWMDLGKQTRERK